MGIRPGHNSLNVLTKKSGACVTTRRTRFNNQYLKQYMKLKQVQPAHYVPLSPDDFIGPAQHIARIFAAKATRLRDSKDDHVKYVLTGQPGVGKTKLAEFFANQLTGERIVRGQSFSVESINGVNINVNVVRRWQANARYIPLTWTVKIINELDTCNQDAQDLLLTFLDELPGRSAVIGTSNLKLHELDERFHSRFQQFTVAQPAEDEISGLLTRFGVPKKTASQISFGSGFNVRAALLDAQTILDAQAV